MKDAVCGSKKEDIREKDGDNPMIIFNTSHVQSSICAVKEHVSNLVRKQ